MLYFGSDFRPSDPEYSSVWMGNENEEILHIADDLAELDEYVKGE